MFLTSAVAEREPGGQAHGTRGSACWLSVLYLTDRHGMEDNKYLKGRGGGTGGSCRRWFFAVCLLIGGGILFSMMVAVATLASLNITPSPNSVYALMLKPAWARPVSNVPFPHM